MNATKNVKKEGVYYLSYIYEKMNDTKLDLEEEMDEKKKNVDFEHADEKLHYINSVSL